MIEKYALGHAFSSNELFENFPYLKLELTCNLCEKIIKNRHRDILVKRIFKESLRIVLEDIIDNNITFELPLKGNKKCNIHMLRFTDTKFKKLRKSGKWRDIDYLKSMFTGYLLGFYMLGNRTPRVKNIYLNKYYKNKITLNTNNGMLYGDGKTNKTIKDYYEIIYLLFPEVSKQDINRILNFGWKSLYLHNSFGGDTLVKYNSLWCYIGELKSNALQHFNYYRKKLAIKLRILYKRRKILWDGYYYFGLTEEAYQKYLSLKKNKGRPKKVFNFGSVFMFLILDECKILQYSSKYIFRIPYVSKIKYKFFVPELTTRKAELIITREPLKFKDILVNDNEYEFL